MRKIIAQLTTVLLLLISFLNVPLAQAEGETISMLVPGYDGGYLKEPLDAGIADFEAETGVKVEIMSVGWDDVNSRIVQLAQANKSPDIILVGSRSLRQFAEEGIIADLDPYLSDDFVNARVESVFLTANVNDKQYGIPMALSSRALYYRSDLIDEAPTNWDELLETARKVKEEHPDMYTFYLQNDGTGTSIELMTFFYQNEGYIFNDEGEYEVNNPANVETLEYLKQFVDEDLVPNVLDSPRGQAAQMFVNGDLAMFMTGPWEKDVVDETADKYPYATAVLPEGKVPAVTIATDVYAIPTGSQHPDLAWDFIEFMGQEEYQRPISEFRDWFPILKAEQEDERFQDDFLKPFADMVEYGQADPHTSNWDEFNKAFNTAIQEALTGVKTPQEALDDAQEALTK